jgi:hypothetical protein
MDQKITKSYILDPFIYLTLLLVVTIGIPVGKTFPTVALPLLLPPHPLHPILHLLPVSYRVFSMMESVALLENRKSAP